MIPNNREDEMLSRFAVQNRSDHERYFDEEPDPYRTSFQRDRDRLIHSKAFRRLGYKTQVFVNSEGDNYRTRLTHSLEVAQIARGVSAALGLNRDYAESIGLAHDLGHTPFGHAGEGELHTLMENHGGFEHNCQSLRIVTLLESRYTNFNGLNLTRLMLRGMMKHGCAGRCALEHLKDLCEDPFAKFWPLEAAIVDASDQIAYLHHDLEDGLDSGYLTFDELFELNVWSDAYARAEQGEREKFTSLRPPHRLRFLLRHMINDSVRNLIETTSSSFDALGLNIEDPAFPSQGERDYPVRFSSETKEKLISLRSFLFQRLYRHPAVMKMSRRGERIIARLFAEYIRSPEILPAHVQNRIGDYGLHRVVADYISGMTDRFAWKEYSYLAGDTELL